MSVQILPVERIVQHAHLAAQEGLPVTACPYPPFSEPARHWVMEYHRHDIQLVAEATT